MPTRARRDDLEKLRDCVDRKIAARREQARAVAAKREPGDEWVALHSRTTRAGVLGRWEWFAARFEPAAAHWSREWNLRLELARASAAEAAAKASPLSRLTRLLRRPTPPPSDPSADFLDEGTTRLMHRSAWQVGRMDLFVAAVERAASDERATVAAREWRLAGRSVPVEWAARTREQIDVRAREYVCSKPRPPEVLDLEEALDIDARLASHLFWIGEHAEAHEILERVLAATADWREGRQRVWSDETPEVRATYGGEILALHALTRRDGARPAEALAHVRAALLGCLRTGNDGIARHDDLPLIHLVALSGCEPDAPPLSELRTHLPWIAHVLDEQPPSGPLR